MANDAAKVTITKKHKYSMGTPDGGGNKMIFVTGEITMATETGTPSDKMALDLTGDIPNIEGVIIQGDGGYICQYNYATTASTSASTTAGKLEVYQQRDTCTGALIVTTAVGLKDLVFKFHAWGF